MARHDSTTAAEAAAIAAKLAAPEESAADHERVAAEKAAQHGTAEMPDVLQSRDAGLASASRPGSVGPVAAGTPAAGSAAGSAAPRPGSVGPVPAGAPAAMAAAGSAVPQRPPSPKRQGRFALGKRANNPFWQAVDLLMCTVWLPAEEFEHLDNQSVAPPKKVVGRKGRNAAA